MSKKLKKERFFSLMPTEVLKEEDVKNRIEEEEKLIRAGKSFASQLSINRFLHKKLIDFDIDERLNLFLELVDVDFVYTENELHFDQIDIDSFANILEEKFNLGDMYELGNLYIENLLNGKDLLNEDVNINDEDMSFSEVLEKIVFYTGGMTIGDTPNLMLMLVVKKALIGSYLAEKNVESLLQGERTIYNISILK